jgi:hypothetical protein
MSTKHDSVAADATTGTAHRRSSVDRIAQVLTAKGKARRRVPWEWLFNALFIITTTLAIYDRFGWNGKEFFCTCKL